MNWDKALGGLFALVLLILGVMVATSPLRHSSVTRRLDAVTADIAASRAELAAIKAEVAAARRDINAVRSNAFLAPVELSAPLR